MSGKIIVSQKRLEDIVEKDMNNFLQLPEDRHEDKKEKTKKRPKEIGTNEA